MHCMEVRFRGHQKLTGQTGGERAKPSPLCANRTGSDVVNRSQAEDRTDTRKGYY
ncbi:hypothetical protein GCM10009414_06520 [Tatumella terrea]